MPRPRLRRRIRFNPNITYFKPQGVPMRLLEVISLTTEEVEALRLKNIKDLDQVECAKLMKTSQSTFQRILSSGYKKITKALIEGKAIEIVKTKKSWLFYFDRLILLWYMLASLYNSFTKQQKNGGGYDNRENRKDL